MGMTYEELDQYGKILILNRSGPVSMFEHLLIKWSKKEDPETGLVFSPLQISQKVKHFFTIQSKNRHKMSVLAPTYHANAYGNEDNRYNLRQILYDSSW